MINTETCICGNPIINRTHCPYCGAISSAHLRELSRRIEVAKAAKREFRRYGNVEQIHLPLFEIRG